MTNERAFDDSCCLDKTKKQKSHKNSRKNMGSKERAMRYSEKNPIRTKITQTRENQ